MNLKQKTWTLTKLKHLWHPPDPPNIRLEVVDFVDRWCMPEVKIVV